MRCVGLTMLVLGSSTVLAGPLDADLVPTSAQWVVHIDVSTTAHSTIGQMLHKGLELDEEFEELRQAGLDPMKDIFGVTAYGWGEIEEHNMVIIVNASPALADALAHKAGEAGVTGEVEGDWTFYYPGEDMDDHAIGLLSSGDDVHLFIAADHDAVIRASKGRDGAERAAVIGKGPGKGAMIFAAAHDLDGVVPDWGGLDAPHSQFVNSTEGVVVELGEADGVLTGRLLATYSDTETSEDIVQLLNGMTALGRMMSREHEELRAVMELASGLKFSSEGSTVKISLEVPSAVLVMALESRHHKAKEAD